MSKKAMLLALAVLCLAAPHLSAQGYFGPTRATVANPAWEGMATRVEVNAMWTSTEFKGCKLVLNSYGPNVGDPFVWVPIGLAQAISPNVEQYLFFAGGWCMPAFEVNNCVTVSGHITSGPDYVGNRWIVDQISRCW